MVKDIINKLLGLNTKPTVVKSNGVEYLVKHKDCDSEKLDKGAYPMKELEVSPLRTASLQGLCDYILSNPDSLDLKGKYHVHIVNSSTVHLSSSLFGNKQRETLISADYSPERVDQGYCEQEDQIIQLRSKFNDTSKLNELVEIVGNLVNDKTVSQVDNGVSTTVAVQDNITAGGIGKKIKPIWRLSPMWTFPEVEKQPECLFLVRTKSDNGLSVMLKMADSGKWKIDAMEGIHSFLSKNLPKEIKIIR